MNHESNFEFSDFWKKFPFGDLSCRQGDYQLSVLQALSSLPQAQQRMLLDFLDLQWISFLEQLSMLDSGGLITVAGEMDNAAARMQINENIRFQLRLPSRNLRAALFKIPPGALLDKIVEAALGKSQTESLPIS